MNTTQPKLSAENLKANPIPVSQESLAFLREISTSFTKASRGSGLAEKTLKSYWGSASRYIKWLGATTAKDLERDPTGNFRRYLSQMANENPDREEGNEGVSASTQNLVFHSVRFLYEKVLGIPLGDLSGIPRAKAHGRIVDVPPMEDALMIVKSASGKPGACLRFILGTACRLNEALKLTSSDFDFKRGKVVVGNRRA